MYIKSITEVNPDETQLIMRPFREYNNEVCSILELDSVVSSVFLGENKKRRDIILAYTDEGVCAGNLAYNIKRKNDQKFAELFMVLIEEAKGCGYAWFLFSESLKVIFENDYADSVFGFVNKTNHRAIAFFRKHHIHEIQEGDLIDDVKTKAYKNGRTICFSVLRGDNVYLDEFVDPQIAGCKCIHIKTIPTVEAGELSFFEQEEDYDFTIKFIYYISKVPEGIRRGFHAHKKLKQILFCPYGKIQITLDDGVNREEIILNDPSRGILISGSVWREMLWLKNDSVLCVAASELYDPSDYIRDYDEFRNYISEL